MQRSIQGALISDGQGALLMCQPSLASVADQKVIHALVVECYAKAGSLGTEKWPLTVLRSSAQPQ